MADARKLGNIVLSIGIAEIILALAILVVEPTVRTQSGFVMALGLIFVGVGASVRKRAA